MLKRRTVSFVVAFLSLAGRAAADPATAEALFREGRHLLEEGDLEKACSRLAESQVQDPSSGTLINLALCHERQDKLATAWAEYLAAARLARAQGRADRAEVASNKASEMEPKLGRLRITIEHAVPGLKVTRGTDEVGPGAIGAAVPIDAGSHIVHAAAPDHRPWTTTVNVVNGETTTIEVPRLEAEISVVPSVPREPVPMVDNGGRRTFGFVTGAFGLAVLGVGAGFGISSLGSYSDAERACPSHVGCSEEARNARSRAEVHAWVANVAVGVGVIGLAVGTYFVLTAGSKTIVALRPTPLGASLAVGRSF